MNTTRNPRMIALATVAALALAACGSSDSSDSAPADSASSESAPVESAPADSAVATSDADLCDAAEKVSEAVEDGNTAETEDDARAALDGFAQALEDFAEVAPDEIRADADLLADGTRSLADVPAGEQPSEDVIAILSDEEYNEAGARLDGYLIDACDLEI